MESTIFYPAHRYHTTTFAYPTLSPDMYPSPLPHTPQSGIRSSLGHSYSPPSPQTSYYHSAYSQPPPLVDGLSDDSPSSSSSSSNSGSFIPGHGNVQVSDHAQDYVPDYGSNYHLSSPHTANAYTTNDSAAIPRHMWDPSSAKHGGYSPYPASHPFDGQPNGSFQEEYHMFHGYRGEQQPYSQADLPPPHEHLALASYYEGQEQNLPQDAPLSTYTTNGELQSVVHGFSSSPKLSGQDMQQEQMHSPQPTYVSSPSTSSLQYPPSPMEISSAPPQAFVNMQDVSPSPTVSPDQVCAALPTSSPNGYGFPGTSPLSHSGSSYDYMDDVHSEAASSSLLRCRESTDRPSKRHRYASSEDEESRSAGSVVDSGESEREDDGEDGDDDEYTPEDPRPLRNGSRRRASKQADTRGLSPVDLQKPRLAPPVPVPNLTKKSRGRRVPTTPMVVSQNGVEKNVRGYKCKVPGCNKCFQRGEHLKRHVRSIHTNEKPHKCPYPTCGKDFSRHDNLRQHMRVHRNEPLDPSAAAA